MRRRKKRERSAEVVRGGGVAEVEATAADVEPTSAGGAAAEVEAAGREVEATGTVEPFP